MESKLKSKNIFGFKAIKPAAIMLSLISLLWLALSETRTSYIGIIFLPFSFLIVSIIFKVDKNIRGLGSLIIYIAYLLRFTVFPLMIFLGNYRFDIALNLIEPYFNTACIIMIIEMVAVFILLSYLGSKLKNKYHNLRVYSDNTVNTIDGIFKSKFLKAAILLFIAYNFLMYFLYPELLTQYWQIIFLKGDSLKHLNDLNALVATIPGFLYYPFKLSTELLRYLISIFLVVKINKNTKTIARNWILTGIVAICSFSLLSSEQINSIIIVFGIFYYMLIKYNRYDKIIVSGAIFVFIFIAVFVIGRIANISDFQSLGRVVENYFNGPLNTALAIHMKKTYNVGLSNIVEDVLNAIPIIGRKTGSVSLNDIFGAHYDYAGAILPMAGYGYYYFGYFGCWLPAALVVLTANIFDKLYFRTKKPEYKIIMTICVIHVAISVFMYNLCIYFATWIYTFAPLLFLYVIDNRGVKRYGSYSHRVVLKKYETK